MDKVAIIENPKYVKDGLTDTNLGIQCVYNGQPCTITINPRSERYQEIMRQVDVGTLTIADAD